MNDTFLNRAINIVNNLTPEDLEKSMEEFGISFERKTMNKIKGFSWDGIDEKYKWVAQDEDGWIYVYTEKPPIDYHNKRWGDFIGEPNYICCKQVMKINSPKDFTKMCFPREEKVINNPSEFNRKNFEAYVQSSFNTCLDVFHATKMLDEFEDYLKSPDKISPDVKEAIMLLVKNGYTINKENKQ